MAKKNFPTVSVIIPMYNTENYIEECLTSLLSQTLSNIEVIVVDDCSTDNSLAVAENMIPLFESNNKKLITCQTERNSGFPGIPRNSALKIASGEYIYFLDSDDFISETALEELYEVAKEYKADVVHPEGCITCEELDGELELNLASTQKGRPVEEPTLETFDIGKRIDDFIKRRYLWWGCNKLIRREFLLKNDIKFPQITTFEDFIFSFQCIVCAKNYVRVPFVSYYYRIREGSMSHRPNQFLQVLYNQVEGIYFLDKFTAGKKIFSENPNYKYEILDFFVQFFLKSISEIVFLEGNAQPIQFYELLKNQVFAQIPEKVFPTAAYMFVTANIYKLMIDQQSEEISQLKKLLAELQNN